MKRVFIIVILLKSLLFADDNALYLLSDDNFPPYSYIENGEVRGFDIDVLKEIEKRLGINIEIELIPWGKVLLLVENGTADGAFSLFKTEERESWSDFSTLPLHYSSYHVFTKIGHEFDYNSPKDLIGKRVGINRGFNISDEFDKLVKEGTIDVIVSEDSNVNFFILKQGRIDCYIGNYLTARSKSFQREFSMLPTPVVQSRSAYLVFSKKSKRSDINEIRLKIDEILKDMYQDGTIEKIIQNY